MYIYTHTHIYRHLSLNFVQTATIFIPRGQVLIFEQCDSLMLLVSIQETASLEQELWAFALLRLLYILEKTSFCMHTHKHNPSCQADQSLLWVTNNEVKSKNNLFIYSTAEAQEFFLQNKRLNVTTTRKQRKHQKNIYSSNTK